MQNDKSFTIKDPGGQTRTLHGNPDLLTLDDVLTEVGKQGGERWRRDDVKIKVGGKSYGETDLNLSFTNVGITPDSVIEVVTPTLA